MLHDVFVFFKYGINSQPMESEPEIDDIIRQINNQSNSENHIIQNDKKQSHNTNQNILEKRKVVMKYLVFFR